MNTIKLRRAWFTLHKWIGLTLAILIIPLSLSGSALVWHDALDRALNPARYATSGAATLTPDRYVAAARRALGTGDRIATLTLPDGDGPVLVAAAPAPKPGPMRGGPPARLTVYLDPPTARVLGVADSARGAMRVIHVLHGSLLVPGVGRMIVGWIGAAMALSCLTGLWLWWPLSGSVRRGFRWKRRRQLDANLHHQLGFWIALPPFVLAFTGMWIAFPGVFGGGRPMQAKGPDRAALARARPLQVPHTSLAQAIAGAGRGRLRLVTWPTDLQPAWTLRFAGATSVSVDDSTGAVSNSSGPRDARPLMRRLHDGTGMWIVWQIIIFIAGIIPAVLAITGITMWWTARRWRDGHRRLRAADLAPAE